MEAMGDAAHMGTMAALIAERSSRGRVWFEAGGLPAVTYNLTGEDCALLHEGMVRCAEILLAAGAKRLYPARLSMPIVEPSELDRYRAAVPAASDLGLVSYHPLGTCAMGREPKTSVVDLDHQAHDVPGLFVVDGSTVPGPLGVNPQVTIMAMATRAADRIAELLG
jgi:choline dehydrogenase-like flavoprotein